MPPAELVIFAGLQDFGKPTYYHTHLAATHMHVSRDPMKKRGHRDSRQREPVDKALCEGRPAVVNDTNPAAVRQAPLIGAGRRDGSRPVVCRFESSGQEAVARNRLREGRSRVPGAALLVRARRLVRPGLQEGFDEVRVIAPFASA